MAESEVPPPTPAVDAALAAAPRITRVARAIGRRVPSRVSIARTLRFLGIAMVVLAFDFAAEALWPYPLGHDIGPDTPRVAPSFRRFDGDTHGLTKIRFHLRPNARTRAVNVFFGLDGGELVNATFDHLFVSAIPEVPSALQRYEQGRLVERIELPAVPLDPRRLRVGIRFDHDQLVLVREGVAAPPVPLALNGRSVSMSLYPSYPSARYRADFDRLENLRFEVERDGKRSVYRGFGAWTGWWGRCVLLVALVLFLWRRSATSRRWRIGLIAIPSVVLGVPLALVLGSAVRGPWSGGDEEYFDAKEFNVDRFLARKEQGVTWSPGDLTVLSFGGSTTEGSPYDRPTDAYDYPHRLEAGLRASPVFRDHHPVVMNLGRVGVSFHSIVRVMDKLLPRVRPRVVTLSSVYNNAFGFKVLALLAHVTGHPGADVSTFSGNLESFEHALVCIDTLTRGNGAVPLWIEEFVDVRYFGDRDLLAPYHELLARVAAERGVDVVRMQDDVTRDPNRLLFFEYVHPSSLGYQWMADRLENWFTAHSDAVLNPAPPAPSVRAADVEACREFL